jgi:hypothetical protein
MKFTVATMLLLATVTANAGWFDTDKFNHDNTVTGQDLNANGVRDDIDAYIDSLGDSLLQKSALRQCSASIQSAMAVNLNDRAAIQSAANNIGRASACLFARYETAEASKKSDEIEKITVNTKTRFHAYGRFNAALSGSTFALPSDDGCLK